MGGLTLDNANLTLASAGNYTYVYFQGTQTLGGTGQIVFGGSYPYNDVYAQGGNTVAKAAMLTIGPNITVQGTEGGAITGQYSQDGIINQGSIDADTSAQTITVGSGVTWSNTGLLEATHGGTLALSGTFTTAAPGTFNATGGTVNITGTLNNTASTLALTAATGSLNFSGTINNGTVTGSGGAQLISAGGTLEGVTLGANVTVPNNTSLYVINGLTLANANVTLASTANYSYVYFQGTQTLGGTGQIVFGGSYPYDDVYAEGGNTTATAATLTIGPNITVQGTEGGTITGQYSQDGIVNQGTIDANTSGQTITVGSGVTWTNAGLLEATNGGTLALSGTFTIASPGTFNATGGTVNITGTLNNTASILALTAATGSLTLSGTIQGGTITASGGAQLTSASGTLNAVTLDANLTVINNTSVVVENGLTLNGTVSLGNSSTSGYVSFVGSQTLAGTGSVVLGSYVAPYYVAPTGVYVTDSNGPATLTIGLGITVLGAAGYLGYVPSDGYYGNLGSSDALLVNKGMINADAAGGVTINVPGGFTNQGTIEATSGGTLNLGGSVTQLGTFNSNGGTVNLTGTLQNSGSTLVSTAATGSLALLGGTVNGGTISESGGAELVMTSSGGTLNGVTFNGPLDLTASSAYAYVTNGLTLNGTATLGGSARLYFTGGSQTLGGTGTVVFNNAANQGLIANANNMTLTIGAGDHHPRGQQRR